MTDETYRTDSPLTLRYNEFLGKTFKIVQQPAGELVAHVDCVVLMPSGVPISFGDDPADVNLGGGPRSGWILGPQSTTTIR